MHTKISIGNHKNERNYLGDREAGIIMLKVDLNIVV
jgi:hypothetical protein